MSRMMISEVFATLQRRANRLAYCGYLRDFAESCKTESASRLAQEVIMMHPVPVATTEVADDRRFSGLTPPEANRIDATIGDLFDDEKWLVSHERMWCRAIVRALKRNRRWSAVRSVLERNVDEEHECTLTNPEYMKRVLAALRAADRGR